MPRRAVVHLLTCVLALVTAVALLLASAAIGDAGGPGPAAPRDGATTAAVRAFYDALNRAIETGDTSSLDAVVVPDLVVHALPPGTTPDRAGLDRYLATLHATVPATRLAVEDLEIVGDRAMVSVAVIGAGNATFFGHRLADPPPVWPAFDIVRIVDGQVAEVWGGADDLALFEPLRALSLGTRLPARPVVVLERLAVPPGRFLDADLIEESRLVYVVAGTLTVWVDPAISEPALLAPGPATGGEAGRPTEIAPGADVALSPGELLFLPAPTRYTIRNEADLAAEAVVLAAFPSDGVGRRTGRSDPAFLAGGAGTPEQDRYGADVDPALGAGEGQLVEVAVVPLAGGLTTTMPSGPAGVALGRATLAPDAELRLPETAGAMLLCVEAGTLAIETSDDAWVTQGERRSSSGETDAVLATGAGVLLQPGTGLALRNPGAEPVVALVISILSDDA